ncbi:hypothetical protein RJ639_001021, partial [Escallonia herrerae]
MVVRLAAIGQLAVDGCLDLGVVGDRQCLAVEEMRGGADGRLVAIHEQRLSYSAKHRHGRRTTNNENKLTVVGLDFDECVPRVCPREVCITNMSFMAKISLHMHLIAMMEICALCLILRMYVSQGRNLLIVFMLEFWARVFILLLEKSLAHVGLYVFCRYIGHLKDMSLKDQMAKDPIEDIPKAVLQTLRRNKLRD